MPNTAIDFDFSVTELSAVPTGKPVMVLAEMKWLTRSNREVKTLGSTEIVFVEQYFIKQQVGKVQDEKELTDMNLYRSFWNKIWESPLTDKLNKTEDGYEK